MDHPNKHHFIGILTYAGTVSNKAPAGARGHKVILTKEAALKAIPTLIGMSVYYRPGWDGHDSKRKIGIIDDATLLETGGIFVSGYLYKRDVPGVIKEIQASEEKLGMSYEVVDAHVDDLRAEVWVISEVTFIGAAILYKEKAAYEMTQFMLV